MDMDRDMDIDIEMDRDTDMDMEVVLLPLGRHSFRPPVPKKRKGRNKKNAEMSRRILEKG